MSLEGEYQNFDFGRNWEGMCLPHILKIKGDSVQFTPGFNRVFRGIKRKHRMFYDDPDKDIAPVDLSSNDSFCTLTDNIEEYDREHPELLTETERKLLDVMREIDDDEDDYEDDEDYCDSYPLKLYDVLNWMILKRHGLVWNKKNKSHLAFYIPFGCCFMWNKYFGLWLAKKVCPKEKWIVKENEKHCTVISPKSKKVFDILYWGLDGRLDDYCKIHTGKTDLEELQYTSNDETLGGNLAREESSIH